jgi:hypothetical protein
MKDEFWIHPSQPQTLIEEEAMSCRSLLFYYRYKIGTLPLTLNCTSEKGRKMLENDETSIKVLIALQNLASFFRKYKRTWRVMVDIKKRQETVDWLVARCVTSIRTETRQVCLSQSRLSCLPVVMMSGM